jgi:hypothetical protein
MTDLAAMPPWLQVAVATLAVGVSVWSLGVARSSLRAAQGSVFSKLMSEYASPEMGQAVRCIRSHRLMLVAAATQGRMQIGQVVGDWQRTDTELRDAGRRLHLFVRQADVLLSNSIISEQLFRSAITRTEGYRLWAEVWVPYLRADLDDPETENGLEWASRLIEKYPPQAA